MDLGCTPFRAFIKVEIPEIMPGIVTGLIMAFTLSLDDFILSFFTSGPESQTLPLYIYGSLKRGISPQIHALSTIVFAITLFAMLLFTLKGIRKERKLAQERR